MANQRADEIAVESIIGVGASGYVIRINDQHVLKLPRIYKDPKASAEQAQIYEIFASQSRTAIEHEKNIRRRLGNHPGFVEWIDQSGDGILMKNMKGGSLDNYLRSTAPPPSVAQEWILDIADAICHAHLQHVIIGDIASKNVLLDENLKAKLCDLGYSGLISHSTNIALAVDDGASIQTDIFQFGTVMFEILSQKRYHYNLFDNEEVARQVACCHGEYEPRAEWPPVDKLPATEHLRFGAVVRKCWTRVYLDMTEVCDDLSREATALG
jgi:eukaryotic-like serine/threonine-protein kinase